MPLEMRRALYYSTGIRVIPHIRDPYYICNLNI